MDIAFNMMWIAQLKRIELFMLYLISMSVFVQSEMEGRILQTKSGAIRGIVLPTLDSEVDAYLGIPYALPPVGELRFRRPISIPSWSNIYNATTKPPPCYQNITDETYYTPKIENMTEDCLYLNIWVPRSTTNNSKLKEMMVFIHGGAFNLGSSDMDVYDGAILASYGDIIVASINFRIGTLGYLTTSAEGAKGNMAIYDQVLALKWINENAGIFNGDNRQITLFGESSGGMTVGGVMLSPYSQNLFKRVILLSGTALIPLFHDSPTTQVKVSNSIASLTGCTKDGVNITTDPEKVLSCLKSLPASEISAAEGVVKKTTQISFYPIHGDEIIAMETSEVLKRQQFKAKDILMGINTDEGSFFLTAALPEYFGKNGFGSIERVSRSLAYSLILGIFKNLNEKNEREIAEYYIKRLKVKDYRKAIYDALGDYLISCTTVLFADLYSLKVDNVYFYLFSHISSQKPTADWMGSTHFAELYYVFGVPLRAESNYTEEEKELSRRIMSRFVRFAKTGNPNIPKELRWPKYSYEYPAYLELNPEEKIKLRPNHRCEFWRDRFRANVDFPKPAERMTYSYLKSDSSSFNHRHTSIRVGLTLIAVILTRKLLVS